MERQTLHEQTPVYHVCQQCNGEGCPACSDLLILDGEIQLDPEYVPEHTVDEQLEWLDAFSERVQLLSQMAPINGVIGTTPDYPFLTDSIEARLATVNKLAARMPYRVTNAGLNRDVLCDAADSAPKADPVCSKCGKSRFDSAYGCLAPQVYSPAAGDWVCGKKSAAPSPKRDLRFDDRNMYQRREDDLRLAGEWEV
ncbi:hypothetical protein [Aeromonas sobria]|uniref:hypothetical protein n=1 Tax=Aeromonas sobria TaxID=646 RepID=UPI0012FEE5B1|nr:hypothetical protein [Aeromonas sobria]